MRITDGNRIVDITMQMFDGTNYSPDWANDFFNSGSLAYDEDHDAYRVEDIDYCIDNAKLWANYQTDDVEPESEQQAREYDERNGLQRCIFID